MAGWLVACLAVQRSWEGSWLHRKTFVQDRRQAKTTTPEPYTTPFPWDKLKRRLHDYGRRSLDMRIPVRTSFGLKYQLTDYVYSYTGAFES